MEGSSALSTDSSCNQNSMAATATVGSGSCGASKFLASLPSSGLFSSAVCSSNPGGLRVYICEHDTSPPEDQIIKTDQENILIRSLMLKSKKGDSTSRNQSSRKRTAERALGSTTKRALTSAQAVSEQGSKSQMPQRDLQNLNVERIRTLLKEKGLSQRGRKDELISRLKGATERKQ